MSGRTEGGAQGRRTGRMSIITMSLKQTRPSNARPGIAAYAAPPQSPAAKAAVGVSERKKYLQDRFLGAPYIHLTMSIAGSTQSRPDSRK